MAHRSFTLRYDDRSIPATAGERLLDAILAAGIDHRHICGGNGFCTSCRIEVLAGSQNLSPVSALERARLGSDAGDLRLACQTRAHGPATVRPARPRSSRFSLDVD
jgi:adenylate cyclase